MGSKVKEEADRFNTGKPELSYVDLTCMQDTAKVFTFGAEKYSRDNWRKGQSLSKVLDSMMRHIAAIQRGEFLDPESGLPHHGHIGCNAIFLADTFMNHPDKVDIAELKEASMNYYIEF